ncbi:MAG: M13 family metallopeptidase [Hellea sp.]|nr:M13 family metallopeptidase [Hellea sp.]
MKLKHLIVPSLLAISLAACGNSETKETSNKAEKTEQVVPAAPELGTFGVALTDIDEAVKPGDNFFEYVNGTWLKNTEIPADKSRYGAFDSLRDRSDDNVKAIIEAASAKEAADGSEEQKIGDFYAAFMDLEAIEAKGLDPIQDDLARIRAVKTHNDVAALMGDPTMPLSAPVAGWVDVDAKDIENYIFYLTQSGLGMTRDYYVEDTEKFAEYRAAYVDMLETMLSEAGQDDARARAEAVMAYETAMAEVHWAPVKRRKKELTYNKMTTDEVMDFAPEFPWKAMLEATSLDDQKQFVVRETDAIQNSAKLFADTPVEVLKDYMLANYIGNMSAYLPKRIDDARFEFYGKTLRGTETQRDRWKRGVSQIDGYMGEMVGKVYVEKHFPPDSKKQMDELVENLRAAFKDGIDNLEWMGDETKAEAQDKLRKFNPKIGYPEEWTDYSTLSVDRDDLIGTIKSANAWQFNDMISKLGGPIDRAEWGMNPQTVNAYYRPSLNEIVFPAAILQAPFFDPAADPAVNYGGIGAVIGHEMGHGFDDQGRQTDGNGEQRDWWSESDASGFKARADRLIAQYDEFEPLPGEFVNGELSLGENIGDLTGITMGYAAYKRSLNGKEAPIIDGRTGDQRFFLAYAQIWKGKYREDSMRAQLNNGPHSPVQYRTNGIVRNFDAWYEAFDVQPGDALYLPPEERVKIW